jgi:serine/threonine protein kinase
MVRILPQDDDLDGLRGAEIPSGEVGVVYRLDRRLGGGGMGVAFFALRVAPEGECPVVIKLMRPWFVRQRGQDAARVFTKEAAALARLRARIPSTPYVVRLFETGNLPISHGDVALQLPWLAIEFVAGGVEGTTLEQRVEHSLRATSAAFDPPRAARALECLSEGLAAIHDASVIHRDLKPENVLCCGFGEDEVFKITDFGIARPEGVATTFGGLLIGTPGYAAPEQAALDEQRMGPWSDVFGLACVVYFLLTGEHYFAVNDPMDAIRVVREPGRKRLLDARFLYPDLRAREATCRAIDGILARATAARNNERIQTARDLASMLMPLLRPDSRRGRPSLLLVSSVAGDDSTVWVRRDWRLRHRGDGQRIIRSVAWCGDGSCLAVTSSGLAYWNGSTWFDAPLHQLPSPEGLRFVRQISPTQWLVGGDQATLAVYTPEGLREVIQGHDPALSIEQASGTIEDLAVLVATKENTPPTLHALASFRWVKPLPLEGVSSVSSLARLDDNRWLLAGRWASGQGFAALYTPLFWEVVNLDTEDAKAFLCCAGQADRSIGCIGGTEGTVAWLEGNSLHNERIDARFSISAVAVDVAGRGWAASAGRIWLRQARGAWLCVWEDPGWQAPIRALYADLGVVIAMGADGSVVEGRTRN